MGHWISKLMKVLDVFSPEDPARVLMIGLDAAGKTTLLYKLKLNETVTTIPTIGFNVETIQPVKGLTFTVWDVGGQDKIRQLWKHYFQNADGLIYVVDSADKARMQEASEELHNVLESDDMRGVPVVIMANKQDMPGAVDPHGIIKGLYMNGVQGRKWHVQGTCAVTGDGVIESMEELSKLVKEFKKQRRR